ncbi:MAG: hypothetical protein K6E37_00125 [Bacteroidales bacterium]|nr:hypothetical protein [Bacteroidales bacterium]
MKFRERPFEYLRRKKCSAEDSGALFGKETVSNWYKARAFVLHKLSSVCIGPADDAYLHAVVLNDDELMLSVVRHLALYAHFLNLHRRTVITLVSRKDNILDILGKEEYLCNLPLLCKYTLRGKTTNGNSFLDIELNIVEQWTESPEDGKEIRLVFRESEVEDFCASQPEEELFSIDTRKAQYTNRMYSLGSEIDNLPYEDIHSVKRYTLALSVFQYARMRKATGKLVDEERWKEEANQADVLKGLSSIFCSDCYTIRYNSIKPCWADGRMKESQAWEQFYDVLSKSEHNRWVTEKLILGYRPLTLQERLQDESLALAQGERAQFRKALKNNWESPAHVDICSFADLRRIDPDTLKYDSFLVLGIPAILKKVGEVR